jgi:nucleotide-binding universal stress UspA family protein
MMDSNKLKGRPSFPFETIAVAVAFSPKLEAVMTEAKELADLFKARLLLIHIGPHSSEKEATLMELCAGLGIDREAKAIWGSGDPVTALLDICKQNVVDLLILGARRRENVFRHYLGSVARGLCRNAKCSLLLLREPRLGTTRFRRLVVDCVEHPKTSSTIGTAFYFAATVKAREVRFVRELDPDGLVMAATGESQGKQGRTKEQLLLAEQGKLQQLANEHASEGRTIHTAVLSGRPGFTIRRYAEENTADLLVIHSPDEPYRLMDRIFTRDLEFILEDLPSNILVVHTRIGGTP